MELPRPKRLRGWKLEAEKHKPKEVQSHNSKSALASQLLSLWSHGEMSAIAVQKLAHLAVLDGATHPELAAIASIAQHGSNPGNCHRDLVAMFCGGVTLEESFGIEVACVDPKSSKVELETMELFLPHLMFASLSTHDEFEGTFGTKVLRILELSRNKR